MNITFIGGGNMASALIGGLIARGTKPSALSAIELVPAARRKLVARYKIHASAAADATTKAADTLLLAVKPQDMRAAVSTIAGVSAGKLVISIAAGVRLADLSRWLGGYRKLIRCMPNTPALIGAGVSGLYALPEVSAVEKRRAERVLGAVGKVIWVKEESLLDPVTAVSGSGPAYVFWLIEQLANAGQSLGLPLDDSKVLALETVLGAAKLAARSKEPAAVLRERVTSKGGTTEAALKVFDEEKLAARFLRAIEAAKKRGTELGEMLGKD